MILQHFAGEPRPAQATLLTQLEAAWADNTVIVVPGATGTGKSLLADCVARWAWAEHKLSSALIVPNNVLLGQYRKQFPHRATVSGMGTYTCLDFKQSCGETLAGAGRHCKHCPYLKAKRSVKNSSSVVANYHSYWAHDIEKAVLIVDEAHAVIPFVASMMTKSLWWHRYKFPDSLETRADVLEWVETTLAKGPDPTLREVRGLLLNPTPDQIVRVELGSYRKQLQPVIRLVPVSVRRRAVTMWPPSVVRKVVLMSATFNDLDVDELSLSHRRLAVLSCESPIPASRRPVVYDPCYSVTRETLEAALPRIVDRIRYRLAQHPGERGVVHLPYSLAERLRGMLSDPRLLWHTRLTKHEVYEEFVSNPGDNRVLVASGFYEGLDLPGDLGRWQSIVKVPFLNLGDAAIKHRADAEPDWYAWQAIRLVVQAAGRVCRGPDDYGVTYIEDQQWDGLVRRSSHLIPPDFLDALQTRL